MKRNALGKGLDSLISMDSIQTEGSSAINEIAISQIMPNPTQPRQNFDEDALEELAASVRELGIIQPLTLRSIGDNTYQIISGERRYRAALLAGLNTVPAYIRSKSEFTVRECACTAPTAKQTASFTVNAFGRTFSDWAFSFFNFLSFFD